MKFLITFVILSIVNVVFSTIRTITTIKSGKTIASLISGGYFAYYNIVLLYTVADFPMWEKCLITFICNVIGVYVVKLSEERMQKDKLWKVELCIKSQDLDDLATILTKAEIPYNCIKCDDKYTIVNVFCSNRQQSLAVREVTNFYNAKYFVYESKSL